MVVFAMNRSLTKDGMVYTIDLEENGIGKLTKDGVDGLIGKRISIEYDLKVEVRDFVIVNNKMLPKPEEFEYKYIGLLIN